MSWSDEQARAAFNRWVADWKPHTFASDIAPQVGRALLALEARIKELEWELDGVPLLKERIDEMVAQRDRDSARVLQLRKLEDAAKALAPFPEVAPDSPLGKLKEVLDGLYGAGAYGAGARHGGRVRRSNAARSSRRPEDEIKELERENENLKHVIDNGHLRAISKREDELEAQRDEQQRRADGFAVQHEELHARLADALRERDHGIAINAELRRMADASRENASNMSIKLADALRLLDEARASGGRP